MIWHLWQDLALNKGPNPSEANVEDGDDTLAGLIAATPGKHTAPASRAYLYYTDEHKHWTPALETEITAK